MERRQIEVIVGRKEDAQSEAAQLREVEGMPAPKGDSSEAGGRSGVERVLCPYCDAINVVWVDDYEYIRYKCWNCYRTFRV